MNKICVYAICKDEAKFVSRWLDSMQEADAIVVLDTGSTDGTYDLLSADRRVTRVERKTYDTFRFDTARNDSLALVPDDCNVMICTDLDEVMEPGWADTIRDRWMPEHTRGLYKYAWSHGNDGAPSNLFWYDKIHGRGYHWEKPVHEMLVMDNPAASEVRVTFDTGVFLHHYPDASKSRQFYLDLLEARMAEDPDDINGLYYIAREYGFNGMNDKAVDTFHKVIDHPKAYPELIAGAYASISNILRNQGKAATALTSALAAVETMPRYIDGYLAAGTVMNAMGLYRNAIEIVNRGMHVAERLYSWLEGGESWRSEPHDILGVAYYYLGDKLKSRFHTELALKYQPDSERLKKNLSYCD